MIKNILVVLAVLSLQACTTVRYNGSDTESKLVDYPERDKEVTVFLGDHMVERGVVSHEKVLSVKNTIDGFYYDIPAGSYEQIGFDSRQDFYSGLSVIRNGLSDPVKALAVKKHSSSEVCVVTIFGGTQCYEGILERNSRVSERGASFQQTLIYSGRVGDKINISYREFSNNKARPAFNNDVEYDLSSSNVIGYKGAMIEVIKADNNSITYKLIRNFPITK